jgi:hypothetical protein
LSSFFFSVFLCSLPDKPFFFSFFFFFFIIVVLSRVVLSRAATVSAMSSRQQRLHPHIRLPPTTVATTTHIRQLSRGTAIRIGAGVAAVATMAAFGPLTVLSTLAKGTVMSVGGLVVVVGGGILILRSRLRSGLVSHAMTERAAVLCSQFLVQHEPRISAELGCNVAAQLREHAALEAGAFELRFALLPEGTGPASRDETPLAIIDFLVRYDIDPAVQGTAGAIEAPGSVERAVLTVGGKEIDLLGEHHTKFSAIDADFIDVSKRQ